MPNIQLQFRRGTATQWTSANPILAAGEMAIETDTNLFKIGDGVTNWSGLSYGGLQGPTGIEGPTGATGFGATGPTGLQGPTGPLLSNISGDFTVNGIFSVNEIQETVNTVVGPSTSTTLDWSLGPIYYITSMTANFTFNITNLPTTANKSYCITLILIQGATPYYGNVLQITGTPVTIRWFNATVPTPMANASEIQTITLYYSGSAWMAFGQLTSFG